MHGPKYCVVLCRAVQHACVHMCSADSVRVAALHDVSLSEMREFEVPCVDGDPT